MEPRLEASGLLAALLLAETNLWFGRRAARNPDLSDAGGKT